MAPCPALRLDDQQLHDLLAYLRIAMSDEEGTPATNPAADDKNLVAHEGEPPEIPGTTEELLPLPGLAAISLYLLVLAVVIVVGVVGGHHPAFCSWCCPWVFSCGAADC